jgi:uncharacterized membrane protein
MANSAGVLADRRNLRGDRAPLSASDSSALQALVPARLVDRHVSQLAILVLSRPGARQPDSRRAELGTRCGDAGDLHRNDHPLCQNPSGPVVSVLTAGAASLLTLAMPYKLGIVVSAFAGISARPDGAARPSRRPGDTAAMSSDEVSMIAGMVAVTFGIRYVLFAVADRIRLAPWIEGALKFIPPAVLTAALAQHSMIIDAVCSIERWLASMIGQPRRKQAARFEDFLAQTVEVGIVGVGLVLQRHQAGRADHRQPRRDRRSARRSAARSRNSPIGGGAPGTSGTLAALMPREARYMQVGVLVARDTPTTITSAPSRSSLPSRRRGPGYTSWPRRGGSSPRRKRRPNCCELHGAGVLGEPADQRLERKLARDDQPAGSLLRAPADVAVADAVQDVARRTGQPRREFRAPGRGDGPSSTAGA